MAEEKVTRREARLPDDLAALYVGYKAKEEALHAKVDELWKDEAKEYQDRVDAIEKEAKTRFDEIKAPYIEEANNEGEAFWSALEAHYGFKYEEVSARFDPSYVKLDNTVFLYWDETIEDSSDGEDGEPQTLQSVH